MTAENEEQKRKAQEDRDFTSDRISDLSRYISFGVLASLFILISSSDGISDILLHEMKLSIVFCSISAIASIFFDYLHYLAGYWSSIKAGRTIDFNYDKRWISYRLRYIFFIAKQLAAMVAGCFLLFIIIAAIL